jgi:hypothetical protein
MARYLARKMDNDQVKELIDHLTQLATDEEAQS